MKKLLSIVVLSAVSGAVLLLQPVYAADLAATQDIVNTNEIDGIERVSPLWPPLPIRPR